MTEHKIFTQTLTDLEDMERITEAKIEAASRRAADQLVSLLQEELDPLHRLATNIVEFGSFSEDEQAELKGHITRWAEREQYLKEILQKNLGYIDYLKQLLGIRGQETRGLNVGL